LGSPRNIKYCRFAQPDGDRYKDEELAANRFKTDEDMAKYLGIKSVRFIGIDDFVKCIIEGSKLRRENLCLGCYTGDFGFID
jgi:glutamine phosphoribosylpyrophosphate amidotransferase